MFLYIQGLKKYEDNMAMCAWNQRSGCHVFKRISSYLSFHSSVWNEIRMK